MGVEFGNLKLIFMLNIRLKIIVCFALCLSIISCASISTLNLDVLRPAEVTIDPEILSVVVIVNSAPYRNKDIHTIKTPKGTSVIDTIWIDDFPKIAATSMVKELKNKQFFNEVYYHTDSDCHKGELSGDVLKRKIDYVCSIYNAQAVILLENYLYKTNLNLTNGGNVCYGSMDVNGSIYWKIYEDDGYLLDTYVQSDSIFWDAAESSYSDVIKQLPQQSAAIEVLAEYMGETYVKRVAPFWETVSRKYYSTGHYLFSQANDLIKTNNWSEAAKVWYYVYENGNKHEKAMSAFNIALSYEVRSNFPEALAWMQICINFVDNTITIPDHEKRLAKQYYMQLTERATQKKKLDEQIGGDNN